MTRSVPGSILLHATALLLIVLYGTFVDRPVIRTPRTIQVQMVSLPERRQPEPVQEPPAEQPAETPEAAPPAPEPVVEAKPDPVPVPEAPQQKPETKPEPEPETPAPQPEARPDPEPETRPAEPAAEAPAEAADPAPQVSSVTGTDQEIPAQFQYYITLLQGRVARNWNPKRLGFREGGQRFCVIHFTVERDGRVTRETVERSSGVSLFDQEALNAVRRVGRMPPLPAGITGQNLGVHFTFTLETGP